MSFTENLDVPKGMAFTRSKADRKRRAWMKKHRAMIITYSRQLNRRQPLRYTTVFAVDWITKNGANIVGGADWGMPTKRQAVDKAIRQEAGELKH